MAEPGDPTPDALRPTPQPEVDHDDLVGFSSPRSLEGRLRVVAERQPPPEPSAPIHATPPRETAVATASSIDDHAPVDAPTPAWARETVQPTVSSPPMEHATGLFSVYALILFAVPTLGVSALVALVAVTGRPGPEGEAAMSHFIYQQRTLWAGAVAALLGAILIAVGLGVFVLFALAIWLILRGAWGVWALKAGRAIRNPRGWLF